VGPPEELELEELVPVIVGNPDPPEPDDPGAPDPLEPLGPKSVAPLELDPFVAVPPDPDELAPPKPGLSDVVSEALPQPATEPASPHRIAKVVRRCMRSLCSSPSPVEGLK